MRNNLIEQVLKTIRNYAMIRPGDSVLTAVSGGPDSVLLLHAIHSLRNKLKIQQVAVCNLDHGLRGKDSEEDSAFVRGLARSLGLKFYHKSINLTAKKTKGLSTEEAARIARYDFFRAAAGRAGANVVATGHTMDDQAETILMRLVKGSSLKGLVGISPVREDGAIRFIRPMIELEKSDVSAYLDGNRISYRIDSTNLEPIYFRNVVRSQIIPFLEKYNPRLKRSLCNMAEHLREDFEFIKEEKRKAGRIIDVRGDKAVEVSLKDIAVQPRAIQKEILRDMLEKAGGEVKKLTFRHWKEMESLIRTKGKGRCLDLPGGKRLKKTECALRLISI